MDNYKRLATEVKVLRAFKGLTQRELSEKSGVSESTIVFIEKCKKEPRPDTLIKIAKALDVDAERLLKYII